MEVFTTEQLLSSGYTTGEIAAAVRDAGLVHLARGFYARMDPDPDRDTPEAQHLAKAAACPDEVLALESAALVHRLPLFGWPPDLVQVVEPGNGRSRIRGIRRITSAPLPDEHLDLVEGHLVTSRARTVVDLARVRGMETGLVAWDAARWDARLDGTLMAFDASTSWAVRMLRRRHGIDRARRALEESSAWSQSPMETRSLFAMRRCGLPEPQQQYVVRDRSGAVLGTTDFAWPKYGVLGEYDGKDKYLTLARPGEDPADVFRREKRRQEAMEAEGWSFARWGLEEVANPRLLMARILSVFRVASARPRAAS